MMLVFSEIIQDPSAFIIRDVWEVRESLASFSLLVKRKTRSYLLPFEWTHLRRSQVVSSWKGRLGYGPRCLGPGYHALGRNIVCLVVMSNVFCRWRACVSDKTQKVCHFPLMEWTSLSLGLLWMWHECMIILGLISHMNKILCYSMSWLVLCVNLT